MVRISMRGKGLVLVAAMSAAGCGLDLDGSGDEVFGLDGSGGRDGSLLDAGKIQDAGHRTDATVTADAGHDARPDSPPADVTIDTTPPGPCPATTTTCTAAIPAGWTVTTLSDNADNPCPTGTTAADHVTQPTAAGGSCKCGCQIVDPPSCTTGSFSGSTGTSACDTATAVNTSVGGACTLLAGSPPFTLSVKASFPVLPADAGTCVGTPQKDSTKLHTTPARTCVPTATCAEDACLGHFGPGLHACIQHDGDVVCPAGPFTVHHVVGPSASLACSGCDTCTNAINCGPATLRYYNDSNCTTEVGSRIVDGNCHDTVDAGATVSYFRYSSAATGVTCKTPAPTATATLDSPVETVCCR